MSAISMVSEISDATRSSSVACENFSRSFKHFQKNARTAAHFESDVRDSPRTEEYLPRSGRLAPHVLDPRTGRIRRLDELWTESRRTFLPRSHLRRQDSQRSESWRSAHRAADQARAR